ncbi:hypothetical protein BSL78_14941 [Apostichopus japonicus]|uniref:GREB1-like circularly permuted SF2 helicase domain-containing protein n=1 Tax=Stichopus japonicus TaxID=307972 RepID=A0A2G8KJR3_STIJA|nr:hypothetical protein BSL78_14941 [Apostichopus japonicus]
MLVPASDLQDPLAKTKYFGISDYKETMNWTNQAPLLQSDETFELMAESLLTRYPELHSMMVRTYLLVRQFTVAFMNATTRMVTATWYSFESHHLNWLVWPTRDSEMSEDKLGLQYRFEILLIGVEQKMELEQQFLERLQTWRQRDSSWKPATLQDLDGLPCIVIQCDKETCGETMPQSLKVVDLRLVNHGVFDLASLEQELGLACTYVDKKTSTQVITVREGSLDEDGVSDADDTKQKDDNSKQMEVDSDVSTTSGAINSTINHHESPVSGSLSHQELSESPATAATAVERISTEDAQTEGKRPEKHPPLIVLSRSVFSVLQEAQRKPYPEAAILLPCADTTWCSPLRPLLTSDKNKDKSGYFRQWTDPKAHHYDFEMKSDTDTSHPRRLLLCGPPQIGKTGSYLHFCRVLYRMLIKLQEVEVNDDEAMIPA